VGWADTHNREASLNMQYEYLNPNAGNQFSQNANQWFNSMSQDSSRVAQAKLQIQAQQNAQISQAVSAIMQLGGKFLPNMAQTPAQVAQNGVNNTAMNNLQEANAPRAGLVTPDPNNPDMQGAMQQFMTANPNVPTAGTQPTPGINTAGTAPYTGNQGTNAMQALQKTAQMQKLLGQPTTPEETLRQQSARQALQNPSLLTPQQQSGQDIRAEHNNQALATQAANLANRQSQQLITNSNKGSNGTAAASNAVLPYNMSTLGDPNTLANAPADQLNQQSSNPISVNITKSGTPVKNVAETQARAGVDSAIKAITKQAGMATPMGLDGFIATSGAAVDNGNGTVKYMGQDIPSETWDQLLGLVSSVSKPSQPMSITGGSTPTPSQPTAIFNRYFGQ
jgi:hypothetical protein